MLQRWCFVSALWTPSATRASSPSPICSLMHGRSRKGSQEHDLGPSFDVRRDDSFLLFRHIFLKKILSQRLRRGPRRKRDHRDRLGHHKLMRGRHGRQSKHFEKTSKMDFFFVFFRSSKPLPRSHPQLFPLSSSLRSLPPSLPRSLPPPFRPPRSSRTPREPAPLPPSSPSPTRASASSACPPRGRASPTRRTRSTPRSASSDAVSTTR